MRRVVPGLLVVVLAVVGGSVPGSLGSPAGAVAGQVDLFALDRDVEWSEPLELRATVPRTLPARPTGTVTFVADGTLTLGAATLRAGAVPQGTVVLRRKSLPPGEHSIVASYSGDRRYPAAVSVPVEVRVRPAHATVTLRSARTVVPSGTVARFIARVAPEAPATARPTGSVIFKTATLVRSVPLVDGVATWMPRLPDGVHQVRAVLPESEAWVEAGTPTLSQRVGPEPVPAVDQAEVSDSGASLHIVPAGTIPAAAQVFTAGVTGRVEAVELELVCFGGGMGGPGGGDEPSISVKALDGASPTGAILGTGSVVEAPGADGLSRIALAPTAPVTAGGSYAIVVAPPPGSMGCQLGLADAGQSLMQIGPTWTQGSTALRHRTWVRPAG